MPKRNKPDPYAIELHEWLRQKTGTIQAISEMISELPDDWREVLIREHETIAEEFVKAISSLHQVTHGMASKGAHDANDKCD